LYGHCGWNASFCCCVCDVGRVNRHTAARSTDRQPAALHMMTSVPYPVSYLRLTVYGQDVRMAYMECRPPARPNGAVVLFHGMNFGGFYFSGPIEVLAAKASA